MENLDCCVVLVGDDNVHGIFRGKELVPLDLLFPSFNVRSSGGCDGIKGLPLLFCSTSSSEGFPASTGFRLPFTYPLDVNHNSSNVLSSLTCARWRLEEVEGVRFTFRIGGAIGKSPVSVLL